MERHHITLNVDGVAYVAIPAAEYEALLAGSPLEDGIVRARAELGQSLCAAREHAGLTQYELARRMRRSQALISRAESGAVSVSERYVASVLRACGLPSDWLPAQDAPLTAVR